MSLAFENLGQTVLEIPSDLALWEATASMTDASARWRLYLHQLGASALLQWCQEEYQFMSLAGPAVTAQLWPSASPLDIWQVVGGIAITLGHKRLIVILSEAIDTAEMQVPQEWIDLPDWAGDYYIAAYIDVDDQQLTLWGYSTYEQVKKQGSYDADERTYCLKEASLIQDFSAFWVAQQLEVLTAATIEALPDIPSAQLDNLIERLAQSIDPRLDIPFSLWGALLSNPNARSRLYHRRQGLKPPVNLGQWAIQTLSQGWETLEALLPQTQRPASAFRTANRHPPSQPLSDLDPSDRRLPNAQATISGGKAITLKKTTVVKLVLALSHSVDPDERRNIRIRLYPANPAITTQTDTTIPELNNQTDPPTENKARLAENSLPDGVELILLLTETQEVLQTVQASTGDSYIQLPPFRCSADQRFSVRIQLKGDSVQEDFIS